MKKILNKIFFISFIFICSFAYSEEDISRINELYKNQILDKDAFTDSLGKMGVNTETKEFNDLLNLFLNNSISFETFNHGVINIYNQSKNTNDKFFIKKFKIDECKGNSQVCNEYKKIKTNESFLTEEIKLPMSNLSCDTIKNYLSNSEDNSIYKNETGTRFVGSFIKFSGNNDFIYEAKFQIYLIQHAKNVLLSLFINGNLGNEKNNCKDFKFDKATFMFRGMVLAEIKIIEIN